MNQEPVAVAILAALNAALPASVDAYDLDDVPGDRGNPGPIPRRSVVIDLQRRQTDSYRHGGSNSVPGYFLNTTYRAESVSNCRELRRLVSAALEDQAVGAYGPLVWNDETQPIDDDPDWGYSGVDTWTFC